MNTDLLNNSRPQKIDQKFFTLALWLARLAVDKCSTTPSFHYFHCSGPELHYASIHIKYFAAQNADHSVNRPTSARHPDLCCLINCKISNIPHRRIKQQGFLVNPRGRFREPEITCNSQNESAGQRTNEFHRFIPFLGFLHSSGFLFKSMFKSI